MQPDSVRRSIRHGNNLEKYLDYIKEQETDYSIGEDEVTFIRSGIENLVQTIYDRITKKNPRGIDELNEDCILKVGSFYEGTKNKFPDEFDFIFVLAVLANEVDTSGKITIGSLKMQERKDFHTLVKEVLHKNLVYSDNASRELYFEKFVKVQGPALKLMFIYKKDKFKDKTLHVDIVPAFKIVDPKLDVSVQTICSLEPFRNEILRTGRYLLVGFYDDLAVSFTESEVHFMKHILSKKHVTVYKLLKYFLGGHGHAEIVREGIRGEGFSSYMIKIAMIRHHYECENTDSEDIGPCVMAVLENLLRYKRETYYSTLTYLAFGNKHGKTENILERRIRQLRYMQKSTNCLNLFYKKLVLTPVGKQRLNMYRREEFWRVYKGLIVILFLAVGIFLLINIEPIAGLIKQNS